MFSLKPIKTDYTVKDIRRCGSEYSCRSCSKIVFLVVLFGFLLIGTFGVHAQSVFYVRAGATGAQNGSDWNNAFTTLPATLVRGATYYIADGSYSGYTFNTPGTSVITIKKATIASHGADLGWQNNYGDGQATFTGSFIFTTDYWTIDGSTRNESNWADGLSYGIKVSSIITNASVFGHASDHVTLKYLDIGGDYGSTYNPSYEANAIYLGGFSEVVEYWLVQRCYIHNVITAGQHAGVDNITYEYNYIGPNWQKTGIRHQIRGSNCVYRYNIFKNACQGKPDDSTAGGCTAIIGWYGNAGSSNEDYSNSKVYGNLFWDTIGTVYYSDAAIFMGDDRTSQGGGPQNCAGCLIFNNTFVGMHNGTAALSFTGIKTGSEARNNIWYDVLALKGCSAALCSNNVVISSSGTFVNAAGGNFRLSSDGAAGTGYTLSSNYNVDMDGTTRGAVGVWDIGAFEWGSNTSPASPSGLKITN